MRYSATKANLNKSGACSAWALEKKTRSISVGSAKVMVNVSPAAMKR